MSRVVIGVLAVCVAACGSSPAAPPARAAPAPSSSRVSTGSIMATLRRLEAIAQAHGGNRAAGTPGGEASIDEIVARLRGAGYAVQTQAVRFPFFTERSRPRVDVDGRRLAAGRDVSTLDFSAGGDAEGGAFHVKRLGCAATDFAGVARGAIAVARRGRCTLRSKAISAQRSGAAALLVIDDGTAGGGSFHGTLGAPGVGIPVLGTSASAGRALQRDGARVRVRVDATSERRITRNVIAETRTGRRNGTLVLGGHSDSVAQGPGINDNGTGVATLLEGAERLAASRRPLGRRVRFAFWGAEELGLYGSRRYVASMSPVQRRRIGGYVNLDMLGSPNPVRLVYDGAAGPPGSQRIEDALRAHFRAARLTVGETALSDDSDHSPFDRAGIPVGGLFSGADGRKSAVEARRFGGRAGRPLDPCYHLACDTVANVDERMLGEMARALASAVSTLAR